jgi:hypothetical protein
MDKITFTSYYLLVILSIGFHIVNLKITGTWRFPSPPPVAVLDLLSMPAPGVLFAAPDSLQIGYYLERDKNWGAESLAPQAPTPGQLGAATSLRTTGRGAPGAKGLELHRVGNFATSLRCEACKL